MNNEIQKDDKIKTKKKIAKLMEDFLSIEMEASKIEMSIISINKKGVLLAKVLEALDKGALLHSLATKDYKTECNKRHEAKSIALIDAAPAFFDSNGIKPTLAEKQAYVDMDKNVIAAKEREVEAEARLELIKNKMAVYEKYYFLLKQQNNENTLVA